MEFLQNELHSSRWDYKDFGGNSNGCPGKLPLAKHSKNKENNTSFHDSPQHYVLQLNQHITSTNQIHQTNQTHAAPTQY